MTLRKMTGICCEHRTKHVRGENAKFLTGLVDGTWSYRWALKGFRGFTYRALETVGTKW